MAGAAVSRPVRSKGCFNCRKKKKGCDLARPSCGQCSRSKQKCTGYDDSLGVVLYTPPSSKPQTSLHRTAMEVKFIDIFWELNIPMTSRASQTPNADWTRVIRNRHISDGPFKNTMLALTLSRIGEYSGNDDVTKSGCGHYNKCLRQVAHTIGRQNVVHSDEIIATCLVLSLYEIMCGTESQGTNWHNHINGIAVLFQLRGSHAFTSGIMHELFASARLGLIFAAHCIRRATFLGSTDWLNIPWSNTPKSLYDKIVDLCAQMPGILEILDSMHTSGPHQVRDWEPLFAACWHLDADLQRWYHEFSDAQNSLSIDSPTRSALDLDTPLTPDTEIDHEHAQALSVYWTTCCMLYTTLRLAWQISESPQYLLPRRIDPLRYARLISRSVSYFSSPIVGEGSFVYYALCIGAASHCFAVSNELDSLDRLRLVQIVNPPQNPGAIGLRIGSYLRGLAAAMANAELDTDEKKARDMIPGLGKKWWGGGAEALTLRPRTKSS